MFKHLIKQFAGFSLLIAVSILLGSNAEAAERSCTTTSTVALGGTNVGSAWQWVQYRFPDSYHQTRSENAIAPEKARNKACQTANKASNAYAKARHTNEDIAKLLCADAKERYTDIHAEAGQTVKLEKIFSISSREFGNGESAGLGDATFECAQFETTRFLVPNPVKTRKSSQFCGDYAISAMKMDRAIEQLGCPVERHGTEDGHRNYCSERSDETVSNGIRYKRGLLNNCLDKLPLH